MDRGIIFIVFEMLALSLQNVYTENQILTCGVVNEDLAEYDAMNVALNNTSSFRNVSVIFKKFNISKDINMFNQASIFLQENVVVLIEGSQSKTSACALSTVTGIPLIRLHGDKRPFDQCQKAVQMSAGYKDYAHASLDIINKYQWKKVALVFDESRLHEAGYFQVISHSSNITVNLVEISEDFKHEDLTAPMDNINGLERDVILLYTNKENIELMLQQQPCQHRNDHKWILQGQVPLNLSCHPNNVVLAMRLSCNDTSTFRDLKDRIGVHFNRTSKDTIALAYDAVQVITEAVKKQPCSSINGSDIGSEDRDAILNCLKKVSLDGVTGPIQYDEDGRRVGIELEILNLRNNSFTKIGTWNSTKRAIMFEQFTRNKGNRSRGETLEGRKLRVVVVEEAPFVMREKLKDGTTSYQGFCIDLLNELTEKLHFTYEIYLSPDRKYGAETENGTWNGMIGELVKKRADVALAALTVTERREKVVDFTVPYMYYTKEMLLKKASSDETIDLLQFANPFQSNVWFSTLACLVVISVAVFVINYFSPYGYKDDNGRGTSQEFSFFNSVWFALACMLQQGGDNTPKSLSGRVLTGCYWFCILIWVSSYTANLAAFFTVKNAENPINNLKDVLKSSYQVALVSSGSTYEFFKSSQFESHRKIWHRVKAANSFVKDTPQGIQWVRERDAMVFITDGPILRHVANKQPCDLTTVPGLSTANGLALAFQANDPDVTDVTLGILHLHENDFLDNMKRKWWDDKNECPNEQETTLSRKRIDLKSMLGVYVVMCVGIVMAFLALIAEILWKRRTKPRVLKKMRRPKIRSVQVQPAWIN